ncbi:MAG: DUF2190 family protein, partial [Phycisphaerae bacterium]|nr:DUF2190 family protein [Phycisphaerae bacterium]
MIEGGFKTFVAGEDLEAHRRVKLSGTEVIYADAGQPGIGVTEYAVSDGDDVTVRLFTAEGTFEVEAAGTFSAAATLYGADDGKVDDTASGPPLFYAYEAATASGDLIEAIVVHNLDTSDIAVLISDLGTAVGTSDFAAYVSDCATNKSDIVVIKSDRTVSASDITALRSDVTILQSDRTTAES